MREQNFDFGYFKIDMTHLWEIGNNILWNSEFLQLLSKYHNSLKYKFSSGQVGFYDWPTTIKDELIEKIQKTAIEIRANYDCAVIFGIGGSHLGAAAVLDSMRDFSDQSNFPIYWVNNIDPYAIRQVEYQTKNKNSIYIAISKSGGTIETLAGLFYFCKSIDPKNLIFVTDPKKGYLRELSKELNITSFDVPENIGGRFSVLTPVGLLPIQIGNVSAEELIIGARSMREWMEKTSPQENPAYLLALAFYLWDTKKNHSVQYIMPYWSNLKLFADWFVQLWAESLGKKTISDSRIAVGFTPVSALGTRDQHSVLQLFKEGPPNKLIGFLDIERSVSPINIEKPHFNTKNYEFLLNHSFDEITHLASIATEKSLNNALLPTYRITIPTLTPESIGALLFFFEVACAFAGELYNVNAFDQPGVEESKIILKKLLTK